MLRSGGAEIQAAIGMKLTRRQFGGFAAALPIAAGTIVNDPEVVIVGAGAAGIAAARVLMNGGRRVQVLEAAPRIGGRCYTDTATFGFPFDRGAQWLHRFDKNPLTGLAKLHRFETVPHDPQEMLFVSGRLAPAGANASYERAYGDVSTALAHAAEDEADLPAGQVLGALSGTDIDAWGPTAAASIGPLNMGVDFEAMSIKDWFELDEEEPNALVRQGLGTLIARLGAGVPVAVNTTVRAVSSGRGQVRVTTDRGIVTARAAIVTVSAGVLSSDAIGFDPGFDSTMQSALGGLQMGLLSKIALFYAPRSPALAFAEGSVLVPQVKDERGHYFLVRPLGVPLVMCFIGGSLAWDLATQSEATNISFARDRLRALLGARADQGLRGGASTSWGANPLTRGAYAAAKPGASHARYALSTPIGERVFLAGEALAGKASQTAHGAYQSGEAAARRVMQLLKR